MDLNNRKVLVIGLGVSGISNIKSLDKLGAKIYLMDAKSEKELSKELKEIKNIKINKYLNNTKPDLTKIDLVIKNPGVPFDNEVVVEAKKLNIDVVTDLELAYRLGLSNNLIVITGTNGKTTTTSLVGEIFKASGKNTHIIGNIGVGILWELLNADKDDIAVIEASSFQLDGCKNLKPKVSSILNLSPDHLNWHKTYDNYFKAKQKVLCNQDKDDFTVLNYDDIELRTFAKDSDLNIIWFSRKEELEQGIFLKEENIIFRDKLKEIEIININELQILGTHNIENAMAAIGISLSMDIDIDVIRTSLREFGGVEHRIEYIDSIKARKFYNDSKGTNVDASIKAIEAIDKNIILIAGGANKDSSYDEFIEAFEGRVKHLVLLGETKYDIEKSALEHGFKNISVVNNMEEAVKESFKVSNSEDNILLSPACASLDMYNSFEARGDDFRKNVLMLKEE